MCCLCLELWGHSPTRHSRGFWGVAWGAQGGVKEAADPAYTQPPAPLASCRFIILSSMSHLPGSRVQSSGNPMWFRRSLSTVSFTTLAGLAFMITIRWPLALAIPPPEYFSLLKV